MGRSANRQAESGWPRAPRASLGLRVSAAHVNGFVWTIVSWVAALGLFIFVLRFTDPPAYIPVFKVIVLVDLALVARYGWSPGMRLTGLRVVDENGRPPGWRHSALRTLVLVSPYEALLAAVFFAGASVPNASFIGFVPVLWPALILLSIASHPANLGWHDRASATHVVDVRSSTLSDRLRRLDSPVLTPRPR